MTLRSLVFLAALQVMTSVSTAQVPKTDPTPTTADLTDRAFLYEVARHLYRWYLDQADVTDPIAQQEFVFAVRQLHPRLDPGDRSRFGEIVLPQVGVSVKVKQANYQIEELGLNVANDGFKITSVERIPVSNTVPAGFIEIRVAYPEMRDHLLQTRARLQPPDPRLRARLSEVVREELEEDLSSRDKPIPSGEQIIHLATLSPVANEAWIFWETGRMLLHFSSDIDLANPAVWEHEELAVRFYDVDEQVVVTLDEVGGSDAYLTRDHVGRVLFNCVVLGERLTVPPLDDRASDAEAAADTERHRQ